MGRSAKAAALGMVAESALAAPAAAAPKPLP